MIKPGREGVKRRENKEEKTQVVAGKQQMVVNGQLATLENCTGI